MVEKFAKDGAALRAVESCEPSDGASGGEDDTFSLEEELGGFTDGVSG